MRQCVRLCDVLRAAVASAAAATLFPHLAFAAYEAPDAGNPYGPPATYYNNALNGGVANLKSNLFTITSTGYTGITYFNTTAALKVIDADPANSSNVILIYSRESVAANTYPNTWNKEHMWCDSRLGDGNNDPSSGYIGCASDLFNLRPCRATINSDRSNDNYSGANLTGNYSETSSLWFPGDADKGEIARAMFYMATRWGPTAANLQLVNGNPAAFLSQLGDLQSLLVWNYTSGVDNYERRRNDAIFDTYQHNRNPYVDHPEYVWAAFGNTTNDSTISIATPATTGASSTTVDFGRVMKNSAVAAGNITFTKNGTAPTTFDITTSGTATLVAGGTTSPYLQAGVGQGITYNNQTRSLYVSTSTAATGALSGTITIDNTDLTTAGNGKGSADGNDTISIAGSVLDKRTVTPSGNVAFGTVITGAALTGNVTLSTTGDDVHFTRVNVAGSSATDGNGMALSGNTTLFNAANSTGSRTLGGTITGTGAKSGSLTLGVTTAENFGNGLTGEGSYAAVSVGYTATVLAHSNASFGNVTDVNTLTIDFGTLVLASASGTASQNFSINNLNSVPGFTAGLDLTSFTFTGSGFTSNLGNFTNLAAGNANNFATSLGTYTDGGFSQTYTLNVSDQNLPGATTNSALTLNLVGNITSITSGNITIDAGATALSNGVQADILTVNGTLNIRPNHNATGAGRVNNLIIGTDTNGAYTGKVEIANNAIAVQTTDTNDKSLKITAAIAQVLAGENGGDWLGNGITSSTAAASNGAKGIGVYDNAELHLTELFPGGPALDDSSLIIGAAYLGDTNFDGFVDIKDLTAIANHWQTSQTTWATGDINFDGFVDIKDLTAVANNWQVVAFGSGDFASAAALFPQFAGVPEPASLTMIALAGTLLLRRRRT